MGILLLFLIKQKRQNFSFGFFDLGKCEVFFVRLLRVNYSLKILFISYKISLGSYLASSRYL